MNILGQYKHLSKEVYIISLSRLVNTLGAFIWPLFVMILTTKIGLDEKTVSNYTLISIFFGLFASLLGGYLTDHIGRKRTIVVFEMLAILGYTAIVFVPMGLTVVYLLLFSQIMWGINGPAHESLMANVTKTEERESAFSLNYLALNVGIVIGPAVGGLLLDNHFTLFILIDVITSFLSYLMVVFLVHEKRDKVIENEFEQTQNISLFRIILDRPAVFFYGLLALVISFAYGQFDLTLPLYVKNLFGANASKIFGFMYSLNGLTVVLSVALVTYLFRKVNALRKIAIGLLVYISILVLYAFNTSIVSMFVLIFIFTVGEVIISIGSAPILSKIVPENLLGRTTGLLFLFYTAGHGLAVFISGRLLGAGVAYQHVWLIVAGISSIGFIYYIWFYQKYKNLFIKVDKLDRNRQLD